MPRAILTYRLPQEADEFQTALDGAKWREVVRELDDVLRSWAKYDSVPPLVAKNGPQIGLRDTLWQIIDEAGLSLE